MGEMVRFPSNGGTCSGFLASPGSSGPGVVVIQEWWGLVDHIKDVCDRFAEAGYFALAPDLYDGKSTAEPDEANKFMMDLNIEQAAKDMSGAVDFLLQNSGVQPKKVGSVGFCMGGGLALWLATIKPISAVVDYYGGPYKSQPDYTALQGPVLGHFAESDDWANKVYAEGLFSEISSAGTAATYHVYAGTEHAFFNDHRPEVYKKEAADLSWERTLGFLKESLA